MQATLLCPIAVAALYPCFVGAFSDLAGMGLWQTRSESLQGSADSGDIHSAPRQDRAVSGDLERSPVVGPSIYTWLQESLPGPWGDVIDAGSGPDSLAWLASACTTRTIMAVTANESSKESILQSVHPYLKPSQDKVLVGKWQDPDFLKGHQYDVVVADWLLGSVEFFAPHFQVRLMRRLKELVKPGGYMLFNGREPDHLRDNGTGTLRQILLDVDMLRDAATLLSLQTPYREMPQWWVETELKTLGFEVHKTHRMVIADNNPGWVQTQLDWAGHMVKMVQDPKLRTALEQRHEKLHERLNDFEPSPHELPFAYTYGIVAKRPA